MKLRKAVPFILPVAVWVSITVYMALLQYVVTPIIKPAEGFSCGAGVLLFVALQGDIVWALSFIAAKKFGFSIKGAAAGLPVMYTLFAVYHVPSQYLFVYTDEWSFMFTDHPPMNRFFAAFWITLQFGIIMLITATAVYAKAKPKEKE